MYNKRESFSTKKDINIFKKSTRTKKEKERTEKDIFKDINYKNNIKLLYMYYIFFQLSILSLKIFSLYYYGIDILSIFGIIYVCLIRTHALIDIYYNKPKKIKVDLPDYNNTNENEI